MLNLHLILTPTSRTKINFILVLSLTFFSFFLICTAHKLQVQYHFATNKNVASCLANRRAFCTAGAFIVKARFLGGFGFCNFHGLEMPEQAQGEILWDSYMYTYGR